MNVDFLNTDIHTPQRNQILVRLFLSVHKLICFYILFDYGKILANFIKDIILEMVFISKLL